jgi:hypothetical protein
MSARPMGVAEAFQIGVVPGVERASISVHDPYSWIESGALVACA